MKRHSYGERDFAFGQRVLTLRTSIGLTQDGLARLLHVGRKAVGGWEAGANYPSVDRLKALITLAMQQRAFPAGREEEEIRALWQAAHQKVLLDEQWLSSLLGSAPTLLPPASLPEQSVVPARETFRSQVDWGEAFDLPHFYGREQELATLSHWVLEERCRLVSVLGMGGIGKSTLAVRSAQRLAGHFDVVLFRSLRDAPACSALLESCLQVLSPQALTQLPAGLEPRLSRLMRELREQRVLLVLDNLEILLQEGDLKGRMRPGFEEYGDLLRRVVETSHQSCLLLTSREKLPVLRGLEGRQAPVRSLQLAGLDAPAGQQFLTAHEIRGTNEEYARLLQIYEGNPLALGIVARTIADLFGGEIRPFLTSGTTIFGGISDLLDEHWGRLSLTEQALLYWLAVVREPVTMEDLHGLLVANLAIAQLFEGLDALQRRSLVERGQRPGSFTLHSVVLEYATARLIEALAREIEAGQPALLLEQGLELATAKEYVRQTQTRLLVAPLLAQLRSHYGGSGEVESHLLILLAQLRELASYAQGYGPANVMALLREERGHLRNLNLSHLAIREVYLQGVELQDTNLAFALMRECFFTQPFDAISAVAINNSGQYWAVTGRRGEVWVWQVERETGHTLHLAFQAHTDITMALAFGPDGRTLASGGLDGSVKLWDAESGAPLWSGWQTKTITCLAFSPHGDLLVSGGDDAFIHFWDAKRGTSLGDVPHHSVVMSLAWSPDGRLLASGGAEGTIRLWQRPQTGPVRESQVLAGHSSMVVKLAFAPDGGQLVSASWDGTLKLWEVREEGTGRCLQTLSEHTKEVQCVAWSPDGETLASGGLDYTIRLWDAHQGSVRVILSGFSSVVFDLAFTPNGRYLLSGSQDGMLCLWEVATGQRVWTMLGYPSTLFDLDWSPDGRELATAGSDGMVSLWQVAVSGRGTPHGVWSGHEWSVYGVEWRPDGGVLASSGWDNAIRLWDPASGRCLEVIRDPDFLDTVFWGLAWSPDGTSLASPTLRRGVLLWEVKAHAARWIGRELVVWFRRLIFSPDSTRLVGGAIDGYIYVWQVSDGQLLQQLAGHHGSVMSVAFSPDGTRLSSTSGSQDRGELFVWDVHSGQRLSALQGVVGVVSAVAWNRVGDGLISGESSGRLRWWDLSSGQCIRVREAHQGMVHSLKISPDGRTLASCGDDGAVKFWDVESGEHLRTLRRDRPYERLNITGISGLTDAQKATLCALGAVEEEKL